MRGLLLLLAPLVGAAVLETRSDISACPGYKASNINEQGSSLTADLILNGEPCNAYGEDLQNLKLLVEYQTGQSPWFQIESASDLDR